LPDAVRPPRIGVCPLVRRAGEDRLELVERRDPVAGPAREQAEGEARRLGARVQRGRSSVAVPRRGVLAQRLLCIAQEQLGVVAKLGVDEPGPGPSQFVRRLLILPERM
jgi:hypothetical protein